MAIVPSRGQNQFVVRFPDGMRERIAAAAAKAGRSMNSEIIHRLESSFTPVNEAFTPEKRLGTTSKLFGEALRILGAMDADIVERILQMARVTEPGDFDATLEAAALARAKEEETDGKAPRTPRKPKRE